MTDSVILDRGYRPYEESKGGTSKAFWAIVRDGYRRALGLRRKARRKLFPWAIIAFTMVSAAVIIGIHWAAGSSPAGQQFELPRYGQYFDFISVLALLFIAYAAPQIVVPDRSQGVLSVYLSRPLERHHYLAAKVTSLATLILSFYLVPQLLLHIALAALSPDGFFAYLGDNLDILWKVPVVAAIYFVAHASVALTLASLIPRVGFAAAGYLGTLFVLNGISALLVFEGSGFAVKIGGLISLEQHPRVVRDWVFDILTVDYFPLQAGFGQWVSLLVIGVVAVLAAAIIWGQYRRLP